MENNSNFEVPWIREHFPDKDDPNNPNTDLAKDTAPPDPDFLNRLLELEGR